MLKEKHFNSSSTDMSSYSWCLLERVSNASGMVKSGVFILYYYIVTIFSESLETMDIDYLEYVLYLNHVCCGFFWSQQHGIEYAYSIGGRDSIFWRYKVCAAIHRSFLERRDKTRMG